MMNTKKLILVTLMLSIGLAGLQAGPVYPVGDINRDGARDIIDAMLIAQYAGGTVAQYDIFLNTADVNLDQAVNILDALLIARSSAGLIDKLPADEPYEVFQNQLTAARKQWQLQGLNTYSMELRRSCFCPDTNVTYRIDVVLGAKYAVINTTDSSQVSSALWNQFPSVEELFSVAQEAIDRKYIINAMTFNSVYAYPEFLSMDPDIRMLDEEMAYRVISYQPDPPVASITWTSMTPEQVRDGMGSLRVLSAVVHGNLLSIQLEYGGGCFEHTFNVLADNNIMYSYPPTVILYVQNDDLEGDSCMALITRIVTVELGPVNGDYRFFIPTNGYDIGNGYITVDSRAR